MSGHFKSFKYFHDNFEGKFQFIIIRKNIYLQRKYTNKTFFRGQNKKKRNETLVIIIFTFFMAQVFRMISMGVSLILIFKMLLHIGLGRFCLFSF